MSDTLTCNRCEKEVTDCTCSDCEQRLAAIQSGYAGILAKDALARRAIKKADLVVPSPATN